MFDITMQQIEIFLTVAERLSLSGAAREMFLNQAGVSRWIQRLEDSLDVTLFLRTNHGVALTPEGEFLYHEMKPLLRRIRTTLKNIRPVYDVPNNILRIGCLESTGIIENLSKKTKQFEENHPEILLDIEYFNFRDLRENLVCENLDCIVSYSLGFGEYRDVETKKIHKFDSYFAVSANHPLAAADRLDPGRLRNETLYLLSLAEMKDAEARAFNECTANGFVPKEFKYLSSREALTLAVRNNRGITISGPEFGKEYWPDIKLFKIEQPLQDEYMIIAWRRGGLSDLTKELIDSIAPEENDEQNCDDTTNAD